LKDFKIDRAIRAGGTDAEYFSGRGKRGLYLQNYESVFRGTLSQAGIARREFVDFVVIEVGYCPVGGDIAGCTASSSISGKAKPATGGERAAFTEVVVLPSSNFWRADPPRNGEMFPAAPGAILTPTAAVLSHSRSCQSDTSSSMSTNYLAEVIK